MAQRRIQIVPDSYYHLYNRGAGKQIIFRDTADYCRFVELLFVSNTTHAINLRDIRKDFDPVYKFDREENLVAIGAYCLMPNHFHILITPILENGIQVFMRKVSTGYSMYFNKRYERTGVLFEGRYKSQYVDSDTYLKYLFSYIHLNPLKLIDSQWRTKGLRNVKKSKEYLMNYKYSSFQDFIGTEREEYKILNMSKFPKYFPNKDSFYSEIEDWMQHEDISNLP